MRVALAMTVAVALTPTQAAAQSNDDERMQPAAESSVYRNLYATQAQMAAGRQDRAELTDALAAANVLLSRASPAVREWVRVEGRRQAHGQPSESAAAAAARARFGNDLSNMDIDQLVELVMMEVASEEDMELRDLLAQMRAANQQKHAQRDAARKIHEQQAAPDRDTRPGASQVQRTGSRAELGANGASADDSMDNMSDLSEMQQMRMQALMDRRQKAMETLSNLMKKQSDTANTIIGNLK